MDRNLHEWYLDVGIILQDGQLEKRLQGVKKCVAALEKEKESGLQRLLSYIMVSRPMRKQ